MQKRQVLLSSEVNGLMLFSTSPMWRDGFDITLDDQGNVEKVSQYWSNGANGREYTQSDKQFMQKVEEAFVAIVRYNDKKGKKLKEKASPKWQKVMGLALADYITKLVYLNM